MSVPAPPTITVPETNRPGLPSPDITIDLSPAARIRAHKLVLAAASPVFHKLLLRDPSATVLRCGSDLASIRSYSSWVLFLRCLYPASRVGDHVSVSKHAALIAGLVHLAYKYKVRRMLIGLESLIICKAHKTPSVMRWGAEAEHARRPSEISLFIFSAPTHRFACQYKLTRLIRSCVDELVPLRATTRMRNSVQTRQVRPRQINYFF